jgi:hypothetical protein
MRMEALNVMLSKRREAVAISGREGMLDPIAFCDDFRGVWLPFCGSRNAFFLWPGN